MPDPFPNELVEAAEAAIIAVVEDKLQWNVNAYGKAWTGEGEDTDFICGGTGQAVLAAVLPRIEQRVIDRLAREAGENPYAGDTVCWCPDDWREPFDKARCPQHGGAAYESQRSRRWREGAACGVAAERARKGPLVRVSNAVTGKPLDDFRCEVTEGGAIVLPTDLPTGTWEYAVIYEQSAALAPERTTGEGK